MLCISASDIIYLAKNSCYFLCFILLFCKILLKKVCQKKIAASQKARLQNMQLYEFFVIVTLRFFCSFLLYRTHHTLNELLLHEEEDEGCR